MHRLVMVAGVVALLAGCDAPVAQQPAECTMQKVAEMPAHLVGGAVLVPAVFNHTPMQMQVDTGATLTAVTPDAAIALQLPADRARRTTVHSAGGTLVTRNSRVRDFEVGGQMWLDQSLVTSPLAREFQEDPPVAGLLGSNYLADFDVELDVPHGRMALWQVHDCSGDFALRGLPHFRLPLLHYPPARMVAIVEIDGRPLHALIDWGAAASVMNEAAATRLGVTPAMMAADPIRHGRGADGNDIEFRVHRFSELRVGRGVFHNVRLDVAPILVRDVDMLLGMDYARRRHLWLSYATDQLFVVPVAPEQQPVQGNAQPPARAREGADPPNG